MIKGHKVHPKLFLFNPISRDQLLLPPLTTFPSFQAFLKSKPYLTDFNIVANELTFGTGLILFRWKDENWTIFQGFEYDDDYYYLT